MVLMAVKYGGRADGDAALTLNEQRAIRSDVGFLLGNLDVMLYGEGGGRLADANRVAQGLRSDRARARSCAVLRTTVQSPIWLVLMRSGPEFVDAVLEWLYREAAADWVRS